MKRTVKSVMLSAVTIFLLIQACSNPVKNNSKGNWGGQKDGLTKLKITEKEFSMDDGENTPEDYYINGDTIYTSYQGNEPYTSFVVQKLDDHYLKLLGPDSMGIEFNR